MEALDRLAERLADNPHVLIVDAVWKPLKPYADEFIALKKWLSAVRRDMQTATEKYDVIEQDQSRTNIRELAVPGLRTRTRTIFWYIYLRGSWLLM